MKRARMYFKSVFVWLLLSVLNGFWMVNAVPTRSRNLCYSEDKRPLRCFPPFVNAAFNLAVEATNTCGFAGPEAFCQQTGAAGATKSCDVCDQDYPTRAHLPKYLTDFHSIDNLTWWQSSTMLEEVQWPTSVNLTINLGKAFEITYVRLKFFSSRPESFAIYKRRSEDSEWTPFQFYSASCEETYNLTSRPVITNENEGTAVCRDDFSDISPLTGGSVAFSTLEGRPRAYEFEKSLILQEWVTATDIRIVLNRINTFRDEVFGDPNVLRSYFYAISDFAIGGRCKCNGHGSECIRSKDLGGKLVCLCQHFTDGSDCERCLPFYNDVPWRRAIAGQITECKACSCNGRSETCYFDEALYSHTGHGGHCSDCSGNTAGANCERCREGFYRLSDHDDCLPCYCHPLGSLLSQCDVYGRCYCKPGVTGDKCDQCQPEYYNLTESGCSACSCLVAGSLYNRPDCDPNSGHCRCKEFVEGHNCDTCKAGYFNLQEDDSLGCTPCFCYGHSAQCSLSAAYSLDTIQSQFNEDVEKWTGASRDGANVDLNYIPITQEIGIASEDEDFVYFVFPADYLGERRLSYNQLLTFHLRIGEEGPRASIDDIVLEGGNGLRIMAPIFAQGNSMPEKATKEYKFRLSEHVSYQWTPRLTSLEFVTMLFNLTSIKIRGTYTQRGAGFLSDVSLLTAVERFSSDEPNGAVEQCVCPEGYVGQFCESCSPGYYREQPYGGPFTTCVPCNCNNHSDDCDLNTGKCICDHNTTGQNCEKCLDGFYGFATAGNPDDCHACPCPDDSRCVELLNGDVACFDCPFAQTGHRCEFCENGYYGDPIGQSDEPQPCSLCECNNNTDPNAVGNCNSTTGECLRCIYNTAGYLCERCLPGYYGDALGSPHGDCQACECFPLGSIRNGNFWDVDGQTIVSCDNVTGLCPCLPNVIGQHCDHCRDGYWNIVSGTGCETCNCDMMGSVNGSCEVSSGQCFCKSGVTGLKCDQCLPNYYLFSPDGCSKCNCDPDGSLSLQCEITTGQCSCRPNVLGRYCNECARNKHNLTAGCIDCPVCYQNVMSFYDIAHGKLEELRQIIEAIKTTPLNNTEFLEKLSDMNATVHQLWVDAKNTSDGQLLEDYHSVLSAIEDIRTMIDEATVEIAYANRHIHNAGIDVTEAEIALNETETKLNDAENYLNEDGKMAVEKAAEHQLRLGQQSENMTAMAQEARQIAERLELEADEIMEKSEKALNTSQDALDVAQDALAKPDAFRSDLRELELEVNDTVRLYAETKDLAEQSSDLANEVFNDSVSIESDVTSLDVPHPDADDLRNEISQIDQTAIDLKNETDDLLEKQKQLAETIAYQRHNTTEALEDGKTQREVLQVLMDDAVAAKATATEAIAKADSILNQAQNDLKTLSEFDQRVNESRREAETALEKVAEIQESIAVADNKTGTAIEEIEGLEEIASSALFLAESAYNVTIKAQKDINDTKEELIVVRSTTVTLELEISELVQNITGLENRIEELQQQAEDDSKLIAEALLKADDANLAADNSSQKIPTVLNEVNQILHELDQQSSIDIAVLDFLEKSLNSAEKELATLKLEDQFNALLLVQSQMKAWVASYQDELNILIDDVENIRQINETVPRDCFKKISLEPTDVSG